MTDLPSGTVTFLFTDIEQSTESAAVLGNERWADALQTHRRLLRPAFEGHGGVEVGTEGDAFFIAFARAADAVDAAIDGQRALEAHAWPGEARLRVRMGIHTGEALVRDGDYIGHDVHRAKRVQDAGHGGQILLSQTTADLVRSSVSLVDLGPHRLKDLGEPQPIFQVLADGLQTKFPRLRSLEWLEHNLPVQLTSFVGREAELNAARELLETTRLLTITGAGGSGKTRLALQLLAEVLPETLGGVWLADLAPLTDATLVAETVADMLTASSTHIDEASASTARTATDRLVEYFTGRGSILLLDNCEHVLGPAADLASTLLRSCAQLKIVVTTREPLGVAGETSWRLPSLETPGVAELVPDDLVGFESTRLFCERAAQADASFRPGAEDARAIAEICRRLDGIPLAIELAASRARVLEPTEIAKRLDDRFRLLTGGSRTAMPRQQTLRATVDWSYDLLDDAQRTLLARLSVFSGGWTLEAAETVCAEDGDDLLDQLSALVDRSLVVRLHNRFRLLDTIRHYAREKLVNSGEAAEMRKRHMVYYAGVLDDFQKDVRGPKTGEWLTRLDLELDNLRSTFEWALEEDPRVALRMTDSWWYFGCRGNWTEMARWADSALAATPDEPSPERAAALRAFATGRVWEGFGEEGYNTLERSLQMSLDLGDIRGAAWAHFMLGMWGLYSGIRAERVASYATNALEFARANGIDLLEADAKHVLALRDPTLTAEDRLTVLLECAASYHRLGDFDNEAGVQRALGETARERRDWAEATTRYELAVELSRSAGCHGCAAMGEIGLANLARGSGDIDRAIELCRGPVRFFGRMRQPLMTTLGLGIAALIFGDRGAHADGARLLGASESLVRPTDFWNPFAREVLERTKNRVRRGIDDAAFDAAYESGLGMTSDEAVAYALELLDRV